MTQAVVHNEQPSNASLKSGSQDVFRSLWASLFLSGRLSGKIVLFCSAKRREGSSTIASALALAGAAPTGASRVALVDFNLRAPSLHKLLKLNEGPGVADILEQKIDPASVAQRVSSGLDLYPAGKVTERSLTLLSSNAASDLLKTLADGYDYVLVDAASVNQYPDSQLLAATARDVVLVSHTEKTPRQAVAQAKKRLEAGGGRLAGLVMNMRTYPIPRFLYNRV